MVVVLGGGLIGLGIAYELAKRGEDVRLIESRMPGRAASWAGAGMLAPFTEAMASQPFAALCEDSLARYPAFVRELHERGGVDARLRLDGILEVAYDARGEEQLRAHVRTLAARGLPARYLERAEAHAREPALGPALRGASLCANEGAVDNRRLGRALHAACAAIGVRIDAGAGDVALEADARRVLGVRTTAGFVPADVVVNATGAWAAELQGVPERHRVPVVPVKGQMLALAMPRGLVRHVVWAPGAYLVPRDDGRLLVGASVEEAGFDQRVTARAQRDLLDAALAAMPALGELTVAETWAGLRPGTVDGLPYLGATGLGGYVVATGHYRNGILLTPATAVAIADIVEGRSSPNLSAFSPLRVQEAFATAAKGAA
jgi:glycine oxidase